MTTTGKKKKIKIDEYESISVFGLALLLCGVPIDELLDTMAAQNDFFLLNEVVFSSKFPSLAEKCCILNNAMRLRLLPCKCSQTGRSDIDKIFPANRAATIYELKKFIVDHRPDLMTVPLFTEAEVKQTVMCGPEAFSKSQAEIERLKKKLEEVNAKSQAECERREKKLEEAYAKIKKLEKDKSALGTRERQSLLRQIYTLVTHFLRKGCYDSPNSLFKEIVADAKENGTKYEGISTESFRKNYNEGRQLLRGEN